MADARRMGKSELFSYFAERFEVKRTQARKARMGRNPATGEAIKIPAKTVVKARIAKQLKDAVLPKK